MECEKGNYKTTIVTGTTRTKGYKKSNFIHKAKGKGINEIFWLLFCASEKIYF